MPKEHMDVRTTKATVRIDNELYKAVRGRFHYGQLSRLFINIFKGIKIKIHQGRFKEVTDYLYGNKPITLPKIEDK